MLLIAKGMTTTTGAMWARKRSVDRCFAVLDDLDGKDHYYWAEPIATLTIRNRATRLGLGVGAGIRQVACGGIGTMLDGGGDDTYEFDYMSHGGGYCWARVSPAISAA